MADDPRPRIRPSVSDRTLARLGGLGGAGAAGPSPADDAMRAGDALGTLSASPATRAFRRLGAAAAETVFGGHGSAKGAALTLASCTIGTGVLALPAAFAESGFVSGLVLIGLSTGFNVWSCLLLVESCVLSGSFSYRKIGVKAFGHCGGTIVKVAVVCVLFGIITGLLVVLRDSVFEVACLFVARPASRWVLSGGAVLAVILPLSLPANISALKYTSMLALTAIAFVTGVIVLCGVRRVDALGGMAGAIHAAETENATGGNFWFPVQDDAQVPGWLKIVTNVPVFLMAFACQVQVPDIYHTLRGAGSPQSVKTMRRVVAGALGSCLCLYLTIGIAGALAFAGLWAKLQGDVLGSLTLTTSNAGVRDMISVARVIMCVSVALTCPLLVLPCRDTLLQLVGLGECGKRETSASRRSKPAGSNHRHRVSESGRVRSPLTEELLVSHVTPDSDAAVGDGEEEGEVAHTGASTWPISRLLVHVMATAAILATAWALANSIPNLKLVLGFTGSTGGALLLYVLPAMFYLRLLRLRSENQRRRWQAADGTGGPEPATSRRALLFGWVPLVIGLCVGVLATGATVYSTVNRKHGGVPPQGHSNATVGCPAGTHP